MLFINTYKKIKKIIKTIRSIKNVEFDWSAFGLIKRPTIVPICDGIHRQSIGIKKSVQKVVRKQKYFGTLPLTLYIDEKTNKGSIKTIEKTNIAIDDISICVGLVYIEPRRKKKEIRYNVFDNVVYSLQISLLPRSKSGKIIKDII